jgi:3-dehydroquinate synthase
MSPVLFFESISKVEKHLQTLPFHTIYFLADTNTDLHCISKFSAIDKRNVISISAGEQHKNLESCTLIWDRLTQCNADRSTLLINIGGGMICDIGGFAASCYKRGISFINVPTSLLGMADASVGGKTGIDFNGYKNLIGTFNHAHQVLICKEFLQTLPERELLSGMAEVLKHYLISNAAAFYKFRSCMQNHPLEWDVFAGENLIEEAISIKASFTDADPLEQSIRKALNFGHTIGHAIESYYIESPTPLLHGESIAIGIICEAFISKAKGSLSEEELETITETILSLFSKNLYPVNDVTALLSLMKNDKKNSNELLLFTLLHGIGDYTINETAETLLIQESISYYNERYQACTPHTRG